MRIAPVINDLWNFGGPFHGTDGKPHSRVTVQEPWDDISVNPENVIFAETFATGLMSERGVPIRWYQRADNSQAEREVPNIKSISTDRSIDADAATCNIEIYNQRMFDNGDAPEDTTELGQPGYYNPTRGQSMQAQARWGFNENEWANMLVPNAIIRTYQGFGGTEKTIEQAVEDGNIILTGIWLVDVVELGTNAMMTLQCRDMMKLLIEQVCYPSTIPTSRYPLRYYRYVYPNRDVRAESVTRTSTTTVNIPLGDKRTTLRDSATDRWYPQGSPGSALGSGGYVLHGHKASDSLDNNPGTFALSVGSSGPTRPFATNWWEYDCGEWMNAVYVHPWAGNYIMYVSVMENGAWQGTATVPYDPTEIMGQSYWVDTGANIPYVASFGVPFEQAREYILPRAYNAQRVRISFRNLYRSQWGPWYYRSGIREFRIRASNGGSTTGSTTTTSITTDPVFFAGDTLRDPTDQNREGYITSSHFWQRDVFGEARIYQRNEGPNATQGIVTAFKHSYTPGTGVPNGHYIVDNNGRITTYGGAPYYGDPYSDGYRAVPDEHQITDMSPTASGLGYWVLQSTGEIWSYGDADTTGPYTATGSSFFFTLETNPQVDGFWLMDTNGVVTTFGAATDFGDYSETTLNHGGNPADIGEAATSLRTTFDGDGYWILTSAGRVQALGAATDHGQITSPNTVHNSFYNNYVRLFPANSDAGYIIMRGDGTMYPLGDVDFFGAPIPGSTAQLRRDGNYRDYSDIVKELVLWGGFLLYDEGAPADQMPAVYGNIESTGSFSEEPLPDDIFDKKPIIDAIKELKEAVGYLCWVDDEGGFRFESPNWWAQGNFDQEGNRLQVVPEIDERVQMTNYSLGLNDQDLRSIIIISSEDPDEAGSGTITTRLRPTTYTGLRGIERPAMWVNGFFQNQDDQVIMAELISLHIWFAQRMGQVTCVANPTIQINDQVRIYERQTSEAFIHYVRGIQTNHDLDSGEYTMTLSTNWLGDGENWVISPDSLDGLVTVSPVLREWLDGNPSQRIRDTWGLAFGAEEPSFVAHGAEDPEDGQGVES